MGVMKRISMLSEQKVNVTNDILWRLEQAIDEMKSDINDVR